MVLQPRLMAHLLVGVGAARAGASLSLQEGPALSALSVLAVIDDDASVRAATKNLLGSHGYLVDTFASAEEFLQSARLGDLACVIPDGPMPAMSAMDLLAHLRLQGNAAPFILITAFPEEDVRARALKAGAICLLAKPFAGPALIGWVETAVKLRHGGTSQQAGPGATCAW